MNAAQKNILIAAMCFMTAMMLYPPFFIIANGSELNMGYAFLFDPPTRRSIVASVNIPLLCAQWFLVAFVSAGCSLLTKYKDSSDPAQPIDVPATPNHHRPSTSEQGQAEIASVSFDDNVDQESGPYYTLTKHLSFIVLRASRVGVALVMAWQVIGLLPSLTWIADLSAIDPNMIAILVLKLAVIAVSAAVFIAIRKLIHFLHRKWYAIEHPALVEPWSV
ncbi:MAG: hypothetical protein C9356_14905 [Oleiphilus sp.]|nr:MAG: hypothetical protein C9356_14905 [Oleiphilus sp.]